MRKDYTQALLWLQKTVDSSNLDQEPVDNKTCANAQNLVVLMYQSGYGTPVDYDLARQ